MPQIEVMFDIDANGILHVSARDKATGKEKRITIKASSGLSEGEVENMVRDAEVHAAEDHRLRQLAEARNHGDALIHRTRKALDEYQEKLGPDAKGKIEAAIRELEVALKGSDRDEIDTRTRALALAAQQLGEKVYADEQSARSSPAGATGPHGSAGPRQDADDEVIDAEFREVNPKR